MLLAELAGPLDRCARDRSRLLDALALGDEQLVAALGGRRRAELTALLGKRRTPSGAAAVCLHADGFRCPPRGLDCPAALHLAAGSAERLYELMSGPLVAILGCARASAQGVEAARGLARGVAAAGITVIAPLGDGIPAGALAGVAQGGHGAIAVLSGGPRAALPGRLRALFAVTADRGCAIAELPGATSGRRFGALAAARLAAALGRALVVVEGRGDGIELELAARTAAAGVPVGAMPGPVASSLSDGPHTLLRAGAALVCGAGDVLELLDHPPDRAPRPERAAVALEPELALLLERVAAGEDTAERLLAAPPRGLEEGEVLLGLARLEIAGMVRRGPGGRYLSTAMRR
jgi:DNA processing protein